MKHRYRGRDRFIVRHQRREALRRMRESLSRLPTHHSDLWVGIVLVTLDYNEFCAGEQHRRVDGFLQCQRLPEKDRALFRSVYE